MRLLGGRELDELSSDAGIIKIRPASACVTESEREVVEALQDCARRGVPATPRGGGTSIPSQSVGRGTVILQDRKEVSFPSFTRVSVQPGLLKSDLNNLLSARGTWMPVDPSSYRSCTVGGMTANNSSGTRTLKYGSTVDYVEELRVAVLGGGVERLKRRTLEEALSGGGRAKEVASLLVENQKTILEEQPKVSKNSSGYRLERVIQEGHVDLHKLFVGSEGTLGVVTESTFRTVEPPAWRLLVVLESSLRDLERMVAEVSLHAPSAVELVDKSVFRMTGKERRIAKYSRGRGEFLVFAEIDGPAGGEKEALERLAGSAVGGLDPMVLSDPTDVSEAWGVRNEILNVALEAKRDGKVLVPGVEDLVVPRGRLGDLVRLLLDQFEKRGLRYISYGHAGDANLHARPFLDPRTSGDMKILDELMEDCFEAVWKMKGSITGEHGDGMLRARFVEGQYPRTYHLMKEIKGILDPRGVMNPGVKIC